MILEGNGLSAVALPVAVLLGFSAAAALYATVRLRRDEVTVRVGAPAPVPAAAA